MKTLNELKSFRKRKIDYSKKVFVYRNLHNKYYPYSLKQNGFVVARAKSIMLTDCDFVVHEKGRQRVLKTKTKNVHAYVKGFVSKIGACGCDPRKNSLHIKIKYDPYKSRYFKTVDFLPEISVFGAMAVCLNKDGCTASYINWLSYIK